MKLTLISGSSRENALSHRVAIALKGEINNLYPAIEVSILDIRNHQLGFIENVWSKKEEIPSKHTELASLILDADAYILISPEYNGSYAPVMKNMLDHFPKFVRKTMGICTYSPGALGGMRAAMHMQQLVCAYFAIPCPQMLLIGGVDKKIDAQGALLDEGIKKMIGGFLQEFIWLAKAVSEAK